MKKRLLIAILILTSVVCMACGKKKDTDPTLSSTEMEINEHLEDAEWFMEDDSYSSALKEYEQVLDIDPENMTARHAIEGIFGVYINNGEFDLAQNIYSYVFKLENNADTLSNLQYYIEGYDELVLVGYRDSLSEAFFSDENKGVKELSHINMELDKFIYSYDSRGFKTVFLDSLGKTESQMDRDLIYYTEDGTLISNLETYIVMHKYKQGEIYFGLYILDTKEVDSDDPIHISDYDGNLISTYSTKIEDVQSKDDEE